MKYYRIHRGNLSVHRNSVLYFLCHSIRDHDTCEPFTEVKRWLEENQIDHFFEARPMESEDGDLFYTALVLNNDSDSILLRLRFDYVPGDTILYAKTDRLQTLDSWTVPES